MLCPSPTVVCDQGPGQHPPLDGPARHGAAPLQPCDHLGESLEIVWDDQWQEENLRNVVTTYHPVDDVCP